MDTIPRVLQSLLVITTLILFDASGSPLNDLYHDIFSDYESAVRPSCDVTSATDVYIDMGLRQIIELNEPRQFLSTIVWLRLSWNDCRLVWNSSRYGNIDSIVVPNQKLWVPDITLYDNAENNLSGIHEHYKLSVNNNGNIQYNFPSVIKSLCSVDVKHFPFDYQACKLTFGSWAHSGSQVNIFNKTSSADLTTFIDNTEWYVDSVPVVRLETKYGEDLFATVEYIFRMERKPLFYVMNLLFPCLLISSMAILGFLLPPASGEKVNLEITVLLSLSVFQLIVLELMPPSGTTVSFIGLYFIVSMILVGFSCLATVVVLNVHFHGAGDKAFPVWLKRYIVSPLSRITFTSMNKYKVRRNSTVLKMPKYTKKDECHDNNGFQMDSIPSIPEVLSLNEDPTLTEIHDSTIRRVSLMDRKVSHDLSTMDGRHRIIMLFESINQRMESIEKHMMAKKAEIDGGSEWRTFALMLDRFCMGLYIIFLLVSGTGMSLNYIVSRETPVYWNINQ